MFTFSHTTGLESLLALNTAIQGNNHPDLTADQSRKNIGDNIVRIGKVESFEETSPGQGTLSWASLGSGLQITTNGFIITAAHVIENWLEDWKRLEESKKDYARDSDWINFIQDQYAVVYPVGEKIFRAPLDHSFYKYDRHHDLALVKAINSNSPKPILFKNEEVLGYYRCPSQEVTSLTRNNNELSLVSSSGYLKNVSAPEKCYDDQNMVVYKQDVFTTSIIANGGDSGSPIVSENGSLLGIAVSYERIDPPPSNRGYASCANIK